MIYLIVFLGGGFGAMLRHGFNVYGSKLITSNAPIGTMTINIIGSLLMGIMAGILAFKGHMPDHLRLFAMTGFLGGFTTFSAFSLEVVLMIERSQYFLAAFYGLISVVFSVMAALFGVNFIGLLYQ